MVVKQQHFVPQCYLKNFANEEHRLFVWDKIKKASYPSHVKNIAQERYFNDFPDSLLPDELRDKTKSQVIENDLSKRMFENFFVWDLTPADPPKSPLKRGTLRNLAPICKGGWGDLNKF